MTGDNLPLLAVPMLDQRLGRRRPHVWQVGADRPNVVGGKRVHAAQIPVPSFDAGIRAGNESPLASVPVLGKRSPSSFARYVGNESSHGPCVAGREGIDRG